MNAANKLLACGNLATSLSAAGGLPASPAKRASAHRRLISDIDLGSRYSYHAISLILTMNTAETIPVTGLLPEGLELTIGLTPSELEAHLRLMAALKMFELGKISSGKAAELAGLSRIDFFGVCARYRVSAFNYPAEEIEEELRGEAKLARASGAS